MDKLDMLLYEQLELQHKLGYSFASMPAAERAAYIKEYSLHLEHELHEMLAELPYFKPWKVYNDESFSAAQNEFMDVLHFMLNIALGLGLTADDLLLGYMNKNKLNHHRQNRYGYKKCVEDSDDSGSNR